MSKAKSLLKIEFTQEICHELLPEWQGLDINISTLSGGITNKLYRIQSEKGDYTVRIYGDKTDLFIDRENEAHTIQEMSEIGMHAPSLLARTRIVQAPMSLPYDLIRVPRGKAP